MESQVQTLGKKAVGRKHGQVLVPFQVAEKFLQTLASWFVLQSCTARMCLSWVMDQRKESKEILERVLTQSQGF